MADTVANALTSLQSMATSNGGLVVGIVAILVTIGLAKVLMRKVTKA